MTERETTDLKQMERLILAAVARVTAEPDRERFLAWARRAIPDYLGVDDELSPTEATRLFTLLGVALWHAIPRPDLGWRRAEQPPLTPFTPCVCGSGQRFRDCCEPYGPLPELPVELVWDLLIDQLTDAQLQEALRHGAVPEVLFARIADRWLAENRPGRVVALLEPLFAPPLLPHRDEGFEAALELLCDAYDALAHWKKKQAFLLRVTAAGSRPLKAVAWQRFSTLFIDEGAFDFASEAFTRAQREAPDSPGTALLELTLLAAQNRDDHARARAAFWHQRFRRQGDADPRLLEFLTHAARDPQEAMMVAHAGALDPLLLGLREWVADGQTGLAGRPPDPAVYDLEVLADPVATADPAQLSLFTPQELPLPPGVEGSGVVGALRAGPRLQALEQEWHTVFRATKPLATALLPVDDGDCWEDGRWLAWLAGRCDAADSLDILDDLATAVHARPESDLPWLARLLLAPLLARAEALVDAVLAGSKVRHLPWSDERNRPALRLLFRAWRWQAAHGDEAAAAARLERLLTLNPRDDHGVRAELMNHYLRTRQDEQALALARRFPTDNLADLAYGEVLALYRLGRQETAAAALRAAVGRLPRIPSYLLRERVKRPTLDAADRGPGADDQAWLYREAMRDVWAAEPGLLAWVKKVTA